LNTTAATDAAQHPSTQVHTAPPATEILSDDEQQWKEQVPLTAPILFKAYQDLIKMRLSGLLLPSIALCAL
jgi:hypothetical protein